MRAAGRQISARALGSGHWRVDVDLPVHVANETAESRIDAIGDSPEARLETISAPVPGALSRWSIVIVVLDPDPGAKSLRYALTHRGGGAEIELSSTIQEPAALARTGDVAGPRDDVDYTARDYDALRSMMLTMVGQRVPGELVGQRVSQTVALVEELAYLGDALSYQQDAVATEAYLSTARRRISMARHAAVLDYWVSEGNSARAWVDVRLQPGHELDLEARTKFVTRTPGMGTCIDQAQLSHARAEGSLVFESLVPARLDPDAGRDRYPVVAAGSGGKLAAGATQATVLCPHGTFERGALVLIEPAAVEDAPPLGQVVRLTRVRQQVQRGQEHCVLHWSPADAPPDHSLLTAIPVCIRGGNFVPVEHGDTQDPVDLATPAADVRYWPKLPKRDPTFSLGDYTPGGPSAKAMLFPPAAVAEPRLSLREARSRGGRKWLARTSLFESGPLDPHYVVEVESSREARLRFGDGVNGMEPPLDAGFRVEQCTGNGTIGNVGPNAIVHIVLPREARTSVRAVRNPSGAFGGTDPEALSSVRLNAPAAFRTTERVVSPGDYEREARKVDGVVDATAVISNTGSWPIALVYVHSRDWSEDDALITPVERRLKPRQPAGVDLEVRRAVPMPVTAALDVTLASGWDMTGTSELVDSAIRGAFLDSARFGFGTAIHRSELVTVMGRLPGIADVWVRELRWTGQPPGEPAAESLLPPLGHVVRIENSPRHPERGTITYEMRVAAP